MHLLELSYLTKIIKDLKLFNRINFTFQPYDLLNIKLDILKFIKVDFKLVFKFFIKHFIFISFFQIIIYLDW